MSRSRTRRAAEHKRAAIYTRKSTSAGLEQDFNSLDAQREACEGYIKAQVHQNWMLVPTHYDDGGFSGATIERPAFQKLLADVDAGRIDVLVVYKVDRLSRSLLDFAKLMDRFNKAGVAFVSVTQNFSTADAMGRLTLNMLMSFAEFEREMIAERTRDKIAAARRKGKWTGGQVPLGYETRDKKLVINKLEAVVIEEIFDLYLDHHSALAVARALNEQDRQTKRRKTNSGKVRSAHRWNKNDVLRVLQNPVYAGTISYRGEIFEAEHVGIIPKPKWQQAQDLLNVQRRSRQNLSRNNEYLLSGLLKCDICGGVFTPASTRKKNGRAYRYYRCSTRDKQGDTACSAQQLPAGAIEDFVVERISEATANGDLTREVEATLKDRIAEQQKRLSKERTNLPAEIAKVSAEGHELVSRLTDIQGPAKRLVEDRLQEIGDHQARLQERLEKVERELAVVANLKVETEWVIQALASFADVWDTMTSQNRRRLVQAIVDHVVVNEPAGKVEVYLIDIEQKPEGSFHSDNPPSPGQGSEPMPITDTEIE